MWFLPRSFKNDSPEKKLRKDLCLNYCPGPNVALFICLCRARNLLSSRACTLLPCSQAVTALPGGKKYCCGARCGTGLHALHHGGGPPEPWGWARRRKPWEKKPLINTLTHRARQQQPFHQHRLRCWTGEHQHCSCSQLLQHTFLTQALITSSHAIFSRGPLHSPVHGADHAHWANCHAATCFVAVAWCMALGLVNGTVCRLCVPCCQNQQFPHGISYCSNTALHNINQFIFKILRQNFQRVDLQIHKEYPLNMCTLNFFTRLW